MNGPSSYRVDVIQLNTDRDPEPLRVHVNQANGIFVRNYEAKLRDADDEYPPATTPDGAEIRRRAMLKDLDVCAAEIVRYSGRIKALHELVRRMDDPLEALRRKKNDLILDAQNAKAALVSNARAAAELEEKIADELRQRGDEGWKVNALSALSLRADAGDARDAKRLGWRLLARYGGHMNLQMEVEQILRRADVSPPAPAFYQVAFPEPDKDGQYKYPDGSLIAPADRQLVDRWVAYFPDPVKDTAGRVTALASRIYRGEDNKTYYYASPEEAHAAVAANIVLERSRPE